MTLTADALMCRGYLPAELPPIFTSQALGGCVRDAAREPRLAAWVDAGGFELATFNLARQGVVRRRLTLPHPLPQLRLAAQIEAHRADLHGAVEALGPAKVSQTTLALAPAGRALERGLSHEALTDAYASVRASTRYLVEADITQCYDSVYTHALGWALAGRDRCKAWLREPRQARAGPAWRDVQVAEELDRAARACQRGETRGLPIGPDTSLVLAEVILAAADRLWVRRLPAGARATRLVDDYRVGARTRADADQILGDIAAAVQAFGMTLNPKKSRVVELPAPIDAPWVTALKALLREGGQPSARQQRRDLLVVFDTAAALARANADAHVFAYALSLIRSMDVHASNWPLAQDLLLQIALAEPGVLPRCLLELLWHRDRRGLPLDPAKHGAVLHELIARHAPAGHSSEVVWSLWGLRELGIGLPDDLVPAIERMDDPFVWVTALVLEADGLAAGVARRFEGRLTLDDLTGPLWPAACEALWSDLIDPARSAGARAIQAQDAFQWLRDRGATLLDRGRALDLSTKDASLPGAYR
ncbi:MAG TPA: RNA-directed DNA polymerase [Myxococcota bacterium]|nr:RNA-directed DNA polymerase [Myxococcota bacterium]